MKSILAYVLGVLVGLLARLVVVLAAGAPLAVLARRAHTGIQNAVMFTVSAAGGFAALLTATWIFSWLGVHAGLGLPVALLVVLYPTGSVMKRDGLDTAFNIGEVVGLLIGAVCQRRSELHTFADQNCTRGGWPAQG